MHELLDIDGSLIRQILGNRNVRRVIDGVPVWEISSTDSSVDPERRRLLDRILHDFPRMILHYRMEDESILRRRTDWSRLEPSVWEMPGSSDSEAAYNFLISREWSIYAVDPSAKIIPIPYDKHHERIAWMRYHDAPLAIDGNAWRGKWLITANPVYDTVQAGINKWDPGGLYSNPIIDKFLGSWVIESDIQPDTEEAETIKWVARMISTDDRFNFIDEAEKALASGTITPAYIALKAGRSFLSDSVAFGWVEKVAEIFRSVEEIRTGEERLVRSIQNVLDIASYDLTRKGMTARIDGVAVGRKHPYESAARIRVSFDDPPVRLDSNMSQIEMIYVPLYVDGTRMHESTVWNNTEENIYQAIGGGPYIRLGDYMFRTQASFPVWYMVFTLALLLVLVGVFLLVQPVFFPGCQ